MKMLKDCDVEVGDIIVLEDGGKYRFEFINPENYHYPYRVFNFLRMTSDGISGEAEVKEIIKKDPKKQILQKIEEHKSEIQILETQLKELNKFKDRSIYKVIEDHYYSGVQFSKGEYIYIIYINDVVVFSHKTGVWNIFENDLDSSKFELVNDPEMKNGLTKFFKGNSE